MTTTWTSSSTDTTISTSGSRRKTPTGGPTSQRGIRQFIAGTGGVTPYQRVRVAPNSERLHEAWGVLKLTLHSNSYNWEFVPVGGAQFSDSGTGPCH